MKGILHKISIFLLVLCFTQLQLKVVEAFAKSCQCAAEMEVTGGSCHHVHGSVSQAKKPKSDPAARKWYQCQCFKTKHTLLSVDSLNLTPTGISLGTVFVRSLPVLVEQQPADAEIILDPPYPKTSFIC